MELQIDLEGHVGHLGSHLGRLVVLLGRLGRILAASLAILPALGTIRGGWAAILGGLGAVLSVSWTRHGADLGSPGTILRGILTLGPTQKRIYENLQKPYGNYAFSMVLAVSGGLSGGNLGS